MASDNRGRWLSDEAAADLSSSQYTFVKYDASGNLVAAGSGDRAKVLQDKPKAGETGAYAVDGTSLVTAGSALTPGTLVTSDANGKAVAAAGGNAINGEVRTAAGAADEICEILVYDGSATA